MMKHHLRKLLLASALTLLPMAVGAVLWYELPPTLITHWGASGEADGVASKAFAVFGMPLILLALFWVCVYFTDKDPKNADQNRKPLGMVIWTVPMISCVSSGVVYAVALGATFNSAVILSLLMGVMFVLIGNYLPKCKQNFTLGIKIRPTLESEENWNATHRLAGKLWFFGGFAMFLCMLLPSTAAFAVIMVLIAVMVIVPVVYAYAYRRRQLKSDNHDVKPFSPPMTSKTARIVSAVTVLMILIGVAVLMFMGGVTVTCEETAFTVEATYWQDITVPYAEIDSVEYREDFEAGTRVYGFQSAVVSLGSFENDEFGVYTRYAYCMSDDVVILRSDDRVLVLGGKTESATKALYEQLKEAMA